MARRKIAPIPLEIVTDCPGASLLPAAAFGSLMRLVVHFWQSDCRPLPQSGDRLFVLASAHRPTWSHHKVEIMRIFNECAPQLEAALKARQNKLNVLAELRERGVAARRKRRLEKAIAAPAVSEPAPAPRRETPAKEIPAAPGRGFTERRIA
jgi:hypothetical protein